MLASTLPIGPDAWANTVVLAISEFGRKVSPNGSLGTDHGVGGLAILAGGAVMGGVNESLWPGLNTLYQGVDLVPVVDTRSIFKGVLQQHFGLGTSVLGASVFPSSATAAKPLAGLVKEKQQAMLEFDVPTGIVGWRKETGIARFRAAHGGTTSVA